MAEISRFYGIVITMYFADVGRHNLPHFHARYGEYSVSLSFDPPAILAGTIPRRQMNLLMAWAELHHAELSENWKVMRLRQLPKRIDGLR